MTFHLSRVSKRLFESLIGIGFESLFWFDGAPLWGTNLFSDESLRVLSDWKIRGERFGVDVAIETADIALLKDDLGKILEAMAISRATLGNMRQNLVIALVTVAGLLAGVFSGNVHMAAACWPTSFRC